MIQLVKGLNESAYTIHENNKSKGFWSKGQDGQNVGELLMLVVSELGEAMEAHRKSRFTDLSDFDTSLDAFSNFTSSFQAHVKDSFEDEIADSVIRLLDLSAGLGIDLERHINLKVAYNLSRPQLHGKSY